MKKILKNIKNSISEFMQLFDFDKTTRQKRNGFADTVANTVNAVQAQRQQLKQQEAQYQQQMQAQQQRQQMYQNMMQIQQELFEIMSKSVYGIISTPPIASHIRPVSPAFRNNVVCYVFSLYANVHPVTQQDEKQLQSDINADIDQSLSTATSLYGARAVQIHYPFLSSGVRVRMVKTKGRTIFLNIY